MFQIFFRSMHDWNRVDTALWLTLYFRDHCKSLNILKSSTRGSPSLSSIWTFSPFPFCVDRHVVAFLSFRLSGEVGLILILLVEAVLQGLP
jgi:hypothetical protein